MSNPNVTIDRQKYVGGSDLPSILGLNAKYGTSVFDFAKEKAGIIPNQFKGNQFTKYGQIMEPMIRDYINSIYNANYVEDTIIDKDRGYRGNTDGIDRQADIPIIEIKTFSEDKELDVDYYNAQCQFYMETFNQDKCLLIGYKRPLDFYTGVDYELEHDDSFFNISFDENNIVVYEIKRDKNLWAKIEERIITFKKVVDKLRKNNELTEEQFNKIFYGAELVKMSNKISKLENSLLKFKEINKQYKTLKEDLYKVFEDKGIITFKTDTMTITKVNPTRYNTESVDVAKLKADHEDIYNEYKTITTTNKKGYILITPKKESV